MRVLAFVEKRRSVIDLIMQCWRKWSKTDPCWDELQSGPADRMVLMGDDAGLCAFDLRAASVLRELLRHGPDEACLLARRMAVLCLDLDGVARLEPRTFRKLCWRCMLCESQGRCASGLADDFADPAWQERPDDWRDYCPNAATLSTLGEIAWFRRSTG